jgi:hypothetical protein
MLRVIKILAGAPPPKFLVCLSRTPVRNILSEFAENGGDPNILAGALYQIAEPVVPLRPLTRPDLVILTQCRKALSRLLQLKIPDGPYEVHPSSDSMTFRQPTLLGTHARDTIKAIDETLARHRRKRSKGRPKAPGGVSTPSLVVAFLARAFSEVYGDPCYDQIAILVQSVAPHVFPPLYATAKHLRERTRSLPDGAIDVWTSENTRAMLSAVDLSALTHNPPMEKGAARGRKNSG